jgi:hypothetical protein
VGDPAASFEERESPVDGVGPYRTGGALPAVGSLGAGDTYTLALREFRNGRYVALSPKGYDSITVVNESSERLTVALNETNEYTVPARVTKEIGHAGTYRVGVTNEGGAATNAGEVVVEVQKDPIGADERARQNVRKGPLAQVVEHFTGLGVE